MDTGLQFSSRQTNMHEGIQCSEAPLCNKNRDVITYCQQFQNLEWRLETKSGRTCCTSFEKRKDNLMMGVLVWQKK